MPDESPHRPQSYVFSLQLLATITIADTLFRFHPCPEVILWVRSCPPLNKVSPKFWLSLVVLKSNSYDVLWIIIKITSSYKHSVFECICPTYVCTQRQNWNGFFRSQNLDYPVRVLLDLNLGNAIGICFLLVRFLLELSSFFSAFTAPCNHRLRFEVCKEVLADPFDDIATQEVYDHRDGEAEFKLWRKRVSHVIKLL